MRKNIFHLFPFFYQADISPDGEWGCTLTNEYPFTKYIPAVVVMSVSHVSRYAMSEVIFGERAISGYNYQIATDKAITDSRHNDTPVRS